MEIDKEENERERNGLTEERNKKENGFPLEFSFHFSADCECDSNCFFSSHHFNISSTKPATSSTLTLFSNMTPLQADTRQRWRRWGPLFTSSNYLSCFFSLALLFLFTQSATAQNGKVDKHTKTIQHKEERAEKTQGNKRPRWQNRRTGQNKFEPLTVHIIAHSHCDPGWLSTFEGYYGAEVRMILDNVMRELSGKPHRKFIWSEISFFNRWYEALNLEQKKQFKSLVSNGQIEFVNGGWVQNDEASPDPVGLINQITTGHEYLLKNFGTVPRIGWQIDPFGHNSVTPSLWRLMGFEALVINRIHHSLKDVFKSRQQMEFIWRGASVGSNVDMFTHVLHTHYSAPQGFDWEEGAIPIDANNVGHRANDFRNLMLSRSAAFRSGHLLVPFGDDFKFKNAERQFSNMDRLMEHINANVERYGIKVQYSTLSDYFSGVAASTTLARPQVTFPVFEGDFFPYADNEDSYWTGYYVTRPSLKAKSRKLNHIMRACEILHVLVRSSPHANWDTERRQLPASYWESKFQDIERARMETALMMHHDAITGTSRTHVAADYNMRMDQAATQLMDIMARMIEHLMTKEPNPPPTLTPDPIVFGPPENAGQSEVFHPVVIFNSLAWERKEVVSIRISSRNVRILDSSNNEIPAQLDFVFGDFGPESLTPTPNLFEVSFIADLPPMGSTTYYVRIGSGSQDPYPSTSKLIQTTTLVFCPADRKNRASNQFTSKYLSYEIADESKMFAENEQIKVWLDPQMGLITGLEEKTRKPGERMEIKQKIGRYVTSRSGAYLFRPQSRADYSVHSPSSTVRITRGPIVSTVTTQASGADVVIQLFGGAPQGDVATKMHLSNHISVTATLSASPNTEIVSAFSIPGFGSGDDGKTFYTNSGLEFIKRSIKVGAMAAQNFYPLVLGARLTSVTQSRTITFVSSHSMATGCQSDGDIEFMMHRSLSQDDGRGLAEPVNDASKIDVPLWLSFDHGLNDLDFRTRSIRLNNPVRIFYKLPSPSSLGTGAPSEYHFMQHDHVNSPQEWAERQHVTVRPLKGPLPPHVHLLSLLARDSISDDIVVRYQHIDTSPSTRWVGSIGDLFEDTFSVSEVRRATLALNTVIPLNGARNSDSPFQFHSHIDANMAALKNLPAALPGSGSKDSQNTDEEGVFLSQSALEKLRQDQLARSGHGGAQRRLLQQVEYEQDAINLRNAIVDSSSSSSLTCANINPTRRSLLESDGPPKSTAPLFVLNPLEIHTYIFKLSGSEWAELNEGVMIGVGHTWRPGSNFMIPKPKPVVTVNVNNPNTNVLTALPIPQPNKMDTITTPITTPQSGIGAGVAGLSTPQFTTDPHSIPTASNVLGGHEHTVIPGRTREAWRLIPSRFEYIVVLIISLGGVAYFMQALRLLANTTGGRAPKNRKQEV